MTEAEPMRANSGTLDRPLQIEVYSSGQYYKAGRKDIRGTILPP